MEAWLVLSKLAIFIYIALSSIINSINNVELVVLFLLVLIGLNTIMHILKNAKLKKTCAAVSIFISTICSIYINPMFILLFPINVYEFIVLNKLEAWIGIAINFIALFFINISLIKEYILLSVLSYVICILCYNNSGRILRLLNENDELKKKNHTLNKNLIKDMEYQSQIKYMSQIEERNKIAQEIHDNIGHTISGSLMQLEAVKLILDKDSERASDMLQSTISILREGMESIRATLRNIKPPSEQVGINRLKLMLDEFEINSGIKTNLFYNKGLEKVSYNLWRIINDNVKEALTNTIKYSKASSVKVKIEILNKFIKVEVKDNGIGSFSIKKGLGIVGIEERCENVNGKAIIDGSNGFSIIMLFPI
ncbi:sensor histidine kinase [Clostridium sp. JNZ J1-5]